MLWQPARWRTADGYMPFRLFHVYETEIAAHEAYARVSDYQALRYAKGAARQENGEYTDVFRAELEAARILPPRRR